MPLPADRLAALSGLIPAEVGEALADLAGQVPADLAIVEIGSFRGKSTCYLAAGAREGAGAHVYAVDPWDLPGNAYGKHGYSSPDVKRVWGEQLRSMRLVSRVTAVQAFSTDAATDYTGPQVGLLFVDGDHRADPIRADIEAWRGHLAAGHVIALDDWGTPKNPGVAVVADELAASGYAVDVVAERLAVCRPSGAAS